MTEGDPKAVSYRESHLGKGWDYQESFSALPHRAMLWELEKRWLTRVVQGRSGGFADYLDFACGTGRILAHMQPLVGRATGIDVSDSMLGVARQRAPGAEILKGDLTREDVLAGRQFDLVTAFRFFPNAEPALRLDAAKAIVRFMRPNALLVWNNHMNASSLQRKVLRVLGREGSVGMPESDALALMDACGLGIEDAVGLGVLPISDNHMPRPRSLVARVEGALAKARFLHAWAIDVVYVCRKRA